MEKENPFQPPSYSHDENTQPPQLEIENEQLKRLVLSLLMSQSENSPDTGDSRSGKLFRLDLNDLQNIPTSELDAHIMQRLHQHPDGGAETNDGTYTLGGVDYSIFTNPNTSPSHDGPVTTTSNPYPHESTTTTTTTSTSAPSISTSNPSTLSPSSPIINDHFAYAPERSTQYRIESQLPSASTVHTNPYSHLNTVTIVTEHSRPLQHPNTAQYDDISDRDVFSETRNIKKKRGNNTTTSTTNTTNPQDHDNEAHAHLDRIHNDMEFWHETCVLEIPRDQFWVLVPSADELPSDDAQHISEHLDHSCSDDSCDDIIVPDQLGQDGFVLLDLETVKNSFAKYLTELIRDLPSVYGLNDQQVRDALQQAAHLSDAEIVKVGKRGQANIGDVSYKVLNEVVKTGKVSATTAAKAFADVIPKDGIVNDAWSWGNWMYSMWGWATISYQLYTHPTLGRMVLTWVYKGAIWAFLLF